MKRYFIWLTLAFVVFGVGSCSLLTKRSMPITSEKRTEELLSIHADICPRIPFKMKEDKMVFFSDLHRGMGTKDMFKNNKELFKDILEYYYDRGFKLVLVGDIEEGWGFQGDNIPLILENHKGEMDMEMKFLKDNRYYRIYGNHDDFFRGNYFQYRNFSTRVYPAIIFNDKDNNFNIFVTHGCQGHGLHDAGDEVASWGVYVKYNWLAEIFLKKAKSEKKLVKIMKDRAKKYKYHEQLMVNWAKKYKRPRLNVLITGHTHIPVFESVPVKEMYELIQDDIKKGRYIFFNDAIKGRGNEKKTGAPGVRKLITNGNRPSEFLKNSMISSLEGFRKSAQDLETREAKSLFTREPVYYNPGCGFNSEIPCIEISEGKIRIKFIKKIINGKMIAREFTKDRDISPFRKKYERVLTDFLQR